jgi:hypothetical protein
MLDILKSEFFWGIVVGLALSFIGGWAQANIAVRLQRKSAKQTVKNFCRDSVKNIANVIREMDETRDRSRAIHHDFLALLDAELAIFGRNREHIIHLSEDVRSQIRKFMNDCAVKKASVAMNLDNFYRQTALADQIQAQGRGPEAERVRLQANDHLQQAQNAADKLVTLANTGSGLLDAITREEG